MQYILDIFRLIVFQIIIYFAYASIFVMIAFICRNIGAIIGICIVAVLSENILAQMFSQIEIPLLSTIIKSLPLTLLTKLGNAYPYNEPLTTGTYMYMALIAITLICTTTVIGISNFSTRDI